MRATLAFIARCLWCVSVVGAATTIGAMIGWQSHGWGGAFGFGLVGFGTGSALAAFPSFFLDLLVSFVFG
ncbi:hypothetical protein PWG15_10865 [Ensifer adhaerens]|uniref:hypothetical protein n=1 Tax=Ensifer adhaerens TaxID=106592 RepID=UPI0023A975ED|nr:hypothetical protein [Ensifer adhaerens]WDZ75125.1 hypothetical protein PWG15_10865 [Ensifer adhaerens]